MVDKQEEIVPQEEIDNPFEGEIVEMNSISDDEDMYNVDDTIEEELEDKVNEEPDIKADKDEKEVKEPEKKKSGKADADVLAAADLFKSKGLISSDFDTKEIKTVSDFEDAVYDNIYAPLKTAAENAAEDYESQLIKDKGYDEQTLATAKLIKSGVTNTTAQNANQLEVIEKMDVDSNSDVAVKNRELLMTAMMKRQGLKPDKIAQLVEIAQEDGTDIAEAKEAKAFLKNVVEESIAKEQSEAKKKTDGIQQTYDKYNDKIKDVISADKIMEGANKEQFSKDLYEANHWVSVTGADGKPTKQKMTLWNKTLHELGVAISPTDVKDLSDGKLKGFLELAHKILYGNTGEKKIKEKAKEELENSFESHIRSRNKEEKELEFDILGGELNEDLQIF